MFGFNTLTVLAALLAPALCRCHSLSSYGGSVLLHAEDLVREHTPSRATVDTVLLRLYTGEDPHPGEVAQDPAAHLPGHGVKEFEPKHENHSKDAVMFQEEDLIPWTVFTLVFFILVIFDNFVLHRKHKELGLLQACLYTTFWIAVAGMFNVYIYYTRNAEDAFQWGTGYLLEWMLSVDNLFVFHRIFKVFKTPDELKHKPLFYGIMGAIVFRMIFFLIGETLMHHVTWMHLVFGFFLIYTGYKAVQMDDEEESPEKGWLYQQLESRINYKDVYDTEHGRFFIPVTARGEPNKDEKDVEGDDKASISSTARSLDSQGNAKVTYQPTRLVLVVICLEVTDLVFAVDSVSAIVAQIPDLFLAYTACVFAMLGLRAMFFAIDKLVDMFTLLGYAVAIILIFIGLKLILRSWIHIPAWIVCMVLVSTLFGSIIASMAVQKFCPDCVKRDEGTEDVPEDTEHASARGTVIS